MNCPSCSAPLKADARFCPNCGATINQAASTPAPAMTDRTMIASAVPPLSDSNRMPAANQSTQPYPTQQPQYQQPQYQQPQYQQNYQQPQYQQPQYQQGYPQPVSYNVPSQHNAVPSKNGQLSAMLLILCALAMIAAIFLPFLTTSSQSPSLYQILTEVSSDDLADQAAVASILFGFPVFAVLGLIFGILAFTKRRNLWGVLTLIVGLLIFGLAGLLVLGVSLNSDTGGTIEIGLLIFLVASGVMFIDSIVYLARKKAPR